ncbi:MAG: hypothetical protein MK212_03730 [Saprospiraceae bacterium]|nr:hypothetical protein [Saprospiraceae bacterium]
MAYDVLDDQNIKNTKQPKENPFVLFGWMIASAATFILTVLAVEFFIRNVFDTGESSDFFYNIHEGLEYIPLSFVINSGIFVVYFVFFSQAFNVHLKGRPIKAISLAVLIFLLIFGGGVIWMLTMEGSDYTDPISSVEYWMNWFIFIIGYSLPVAIAYYFAWEKRLQVFLIAIFICLVIFQSFMMVYAYPRP